MNIHLHLETGEHVKTVTANSSASCITYKGGYYYFDPYASKPADAYFVKAEAPVDVDELA